jgi:hypothetical protein
MRSDEAKDPGGTPPSPEETAAISGEAYAFGYPLVLMDVTARSITSVPRPTGPHAPLNTFAHLRKFPDASFTDVVSPNADTLYSSAVLDLRAEPFVLSVPDSHGRYYLMPMLDGWTNVFASPGKRTSGTEPHDFAIVGPHWKGTLPPGLERIDTPTNLVWLIGRTQTNGKADYPAVHAFQDGMRLTPLSGWGSDHTPAVVPVGQPTDASAPVDQVAAMGAETFFDRLAQLMADNPPANGDAEAVARFATIGLVPGTPFSLGLLDSDRRDAVERAPAQARETLARALATPRPDTLVNGWTYLTGLGRYGTDYELRALVAFVGLGANLDEDAIYPNIRVDSDGEPLSGEHTYRIRFEPGQWPPVNAFWSLTMYNDRQFFVDNPIDRYAIGDRDDIQPNTDGSLDLLIQHDPPPSETNWLPAPEGNFNLMLRMYWPKRQALDGTWKPPAVERTD